MSSQAATFVYREIRKNNYTITWYFIGPSPNILWQASTPDMLGSWSDI